jgi:hypothetical protein
VEEIASGKIRSAVRSRWKWYQLAAGDPAGNVDHFAYSDDMVYRWWYERRWDLGPTRGQRPSSRYSRTRCALVSPRVERRDYYFTTATTTPWSNAQRVAVARVEVPILV